MNKIQSIVISHWKTVCYQHSGCPHRTRNELWFRLLLNSGRIRKPQLVFWTLTAISVVRCHLTKMIRTRSTWKQMITVFQKSCHVTLPLEEPLEKRITVNSDLYTTICLPKVFGEIRQCQLSLILSNNQQNKILDHPLYSSNLEPNDFFWTRTSRKNCLDNDVFGANKFNKFSQKELWQLQRKLQKLCCTFAS